MQENKDKSFTATHFLIGECDVVDFGGCMAVCPSDIEAVFNSPIMITKEQAMEFFDLVERES